LAVAFLVPCAITKFSQSASQESTLTPPHDEVAHARTAFFQLVLSRWDRRHRSL